MNKLVIFLVLASVSPLSGCATYVYRTDGGAEGVYPAVKTDFNMMDYVLNAHGGSPASIAIPAVILLAIDVPVSAVIDTVLLPYDVLKK
ncbi:MAG: hypothetical protein CMN84_11985 [Spongiibacteraceae bacterium]|nr:hypothetical protein [Spongiibacteraceae bacterium]